jgi:predicted dehydrogenase
MILKKKIDAVILCVPSNLSFEIGKEVMKNKINLLVEKPLGVNLIQAKRLHDISIKNKVVLKTGYNLRFDNGVEKIKEILKKKMIGEIYFSKIEYVNGAAKSNTNDIGCLRDLGSHIVNLFQFFFPGKIRINYFENTSYESIKEDNGYLSLNIKNVSCLAHHSFVRWKNNFYLEIFGKKGFITLNSLPKWGLQLLTIGKRKYPSGKPQLNSIYFRNKDLSWEKELRYFFKLINDRNYSLNKEGLDTMRIINKCEISSTS